MTVAINNRGVVRAVLVGLLGPLALDYEECLDIAAHVVIRSRGVSTTRVAGLARVGVVGRA